MNRWPSFKRAFFGYYRDSSRPNQNNLTELLPSEWCACDIISRRSWGDATTVHAEAVIGPPSWRVQPAKTWKQRLENYRFLRSGEIWFMGQTWRPPYPTATIVIRPRHGKAHPEINNISDCCYEYLILLPGVADSDPAIYTLRCSACEKVHLGEFPNGVKPAWMVRREAKGEVFAKPRALPNLPPSPPPPKDTRDGRLPVSQNYDEHSMGWLWFSILLTLIAGAFGIYWAIIV